MKKFFIIIFCLLAILSVYYIYNNNRPDIIKVDLPEAREYQDFANSSSTDNQTGANIISEDDNAPDETVVEVLDNQNINTEEEVAVSKINLSVPFTSQAPTANWDQPFQDACEEASILMVDYYYNNKDLPTKEEVESILRDLVFWQQENWGGHNNLTVEKAAQLAELNFGYKTEIINDLSIEKIKYYLSEGIPVIVPADGHKLDNPFFSGDGPDYHMLVIKGYVGDKFITNDPGTRKGADFVYEQTHLMGTIFDWDQKTDQANGPKRAFVMYKN
jgi:hypothetical protein